MSTDRRRDVTITFTSVIYFLLALVHASTALPSSYLKLFNDNQLSPFDSQPFLNEVPSSSGSSEESRDFILLRSGRPISLKEFAASLSASPAIIPSRAPNPVKRQNSGEDTSQMLRLARNMPQHGVSEKMYQIHNIGDLPMFRFGR